MAMLDDLGLALDFSASSLLFNVLRPTLQHVLAQEVDPEDDDRDELDAVHHNVDCKALGVARCVVGAEDLRADSISDSPCTIQRRSQIPQAVL